MKIAIISDVQLHNHQRWSRTLENGRNSRLQDGIDTLYQAITVADGGILIVSGDLFHDQRAIDIAVLDAAAEWCADAATRCERVYLLAGNHDHYLRSGAIHSLRVFERDNVIIVGDHLPIVELGIYMHAFTQDIENLRKWLSHVPDESTVILHQEVKGAIMNGGRVCEDGLTLADLSRFKLVLLGHFHEHQEVAPNVFYIGSPYQIDKGEMGQDKFIALLDESKLSWIPTRGTPQYKVVSYNAFCEVKDHGNHFWEVIATDEEREKLIEAPSKANFEIIPPENTPSKETEDISGSLSIEEAVTQALKKIDREDLIQTALSRLNQS